VATSHTQRTKWNGSGGGRYKLLHDLEAVFLDHRIGQNFLGDALELRLSLVKSPAVEIKHEEFALADVFDGFITEAGEGVVDGLALGIEDGALWHNPDVCFHAGSITFGTLVIEAKRTYRFQDRIVGEGLFWREEYVVGRIGDADFLADVGGITAGCGGLAAFGVDALERGDRDENACSAVTDYLDQ
jgi:hypothetical protein